MKASEDNKTLSLEVLVATMGQADLSLFDKMNLQSDAVIANQSGCTDYREEIIKDHTAKLITTDTRGVGINRNLALLYSQADILLFADDDMEYLPNYREIVISAFQNNPKADIIVFNLTRESGKYYDQKKHRVSWRNYLRYGAVRIAVRRQALLSANLSFSLLFGGGAKYGSGEDSLFLTEALRKGLKIYACPNEICRLLFNRPSTWFEGVNEKYYFDKGALCAAIGKIWGKVVLNYLSFQEAKKSKEKYSEIKKIMKTGYRSFRKEKHG